MRDLLQNRTHVKDDRLGAQFLMDESDGLSRGVGEERMDLHQTESQGRG
jgi:hypothetical protein